MIRADKTLSTTAHWEDDHGKTEEARAEIINTCGKYNQKSIPAE